MSKEEFIQGLQEALAELPEAVIRENVTYYRQYIEDELRKGRSEQEVMDELGEPQWIAKTILEAQHSRFGDYEQHETYEEGETYRGKEKKAFTFDLGKWYVKALCIAIPLLILWMIVTIVGSMIGLAFRILLRPGWLIVCIFLFFFIQHLRNR